MRQEETTFHHRGVYEGHHGRLEMAFAVRELPALKNDRARRPVHLTTVEINNALDFDAILSDAAGMEGDRYHADEDPMASIVGTILDAVMVGDGDADNPDAGGFAYSWANDGSWIEIDYTPLTIRLMPKGVVRTSASG
jgi:hypothetical protein